MYWFFLLGVGWGGGKQSRYWSLKLFKRKGLASYLPQYQIWTFFLVASTHACLQISLANFSFNFLINIQSSTRSFLYQTSIIWIHENCNLASSKLSARSLIIIENRSKQTNTWLHKANIQYFCFLFCWRFLCAVFTFPAEPTQLAVEPCVCRAPRLA